MEQCGGRLDAIVMGAGTGGTISGVARAIKAELPKCQVIGVDPEGSILAGPGEIKGYKVEGIGYDFIPEVLDRSLVDRWIKSNDRDSFRAARQLIRQEGLLVGGSSGTAMWAALQVAKEMKEGQRIVVVLPDSVRNYMTKFVDDTWMRQHGFQQVDWELGTIAEMIRAMPPCELVTAKLTDEVGDVVERFRKHGYSQLPVLDDGQLVGILTEADVLHAMVSGRVRKDSKAAEIMERKVATVAMNADSSELPRIFDRGEVAIVLADDGKVERIVTKLDLIDYLATQNQG